MRTGPKTRSSAAALAAALLLLAAPRALGALAPRVAHTTSLLPTGNILIAGGSNYLTVGGSLASAELYLAASGTTTILAGSMNVARASHTATVLANGLVLVAGGVDAAGTVNPSVEVYDPATNTFSNTLAATARYHHTATSLNNGSVLLCGGQSTVGGPALNTCDYFTPTGQTIPGGGTCAASPGCVNAVPGTMGSARALHTATLLRDGKVWLAGGRNPAVVTTNGWLTTSEKFNATTGLFGLAHNLAEARAYHTAVMMGDGKVLVSGGFNGKELNGNRGILDTQEVYDPVADAVAPASQLKTRRRMHSAVLDASGSVVFFGGLGNITTTYAIPHITAGSGFTLTDTFSGELSTGNSTTPDATVASVGGYFLSQPVVGRIVEGDIIYSSPSVSFQSGSAYFTPGDPEDKNIGLRSDLAGAVVGCRDPEAPIPNNCGYLNVTLPFQNLNKGKLYFKPLTRVSMPARATGGTLNMPNLTQGSEEIALPAGGNIVANVWVSMPLELLGATISSGTIDLTNGTFVQTSSYTVTLTGADQVPIPNTTVVADPNGRAQIVFSANFRNLTGNATWSGSNALYTLSAGAYAVPLPASETDLSLTGTVRFVASQVDISGANFRIDIATIIIRSMLLGSPEYHNPKANEATLTLPDGNSPSVSYGNARSGHTATLLPNNDMFASGGYECSAPGLGVCGPLRAQGNTLTYVTINRNATSAGSLNGKRALHTSTLLPDGTILAAGGTDGPSILNTAEIYAPKTMTSSPANNRMAEVRDLHSATLLPNGRVLVAGGFTTNASSSDSTRGAEIYYPDTKLFLPTTPMTTARHGHTATLMPDGNVLVLGGLGVGGQITPTSELYLSTNASWQTLPPIPVARTHHTSTLLKDGRLLVIGGSNADGPLSSVYAFSSQSGWSAALSPLPRALYSHTSTLLFDGRVLVAGGNDGFGEYNASYIYDPLADTWTPTDPEDNTPLLQPRFSHAATLLPNGTVMISGGATISGVVPTEIEVFHVNAFHWAADGATFSGGSRGFHTMTLALDGNVYALGGSDGVIGGVGARVLSSANRMHFTTNPDQYTKNAPPSIRQSTISATSDTPFLAGSNFAVTGQRFLGATEASGGGAASANSSFNLPRLVLQQVEGSGGGSSQSNSGFVVDLTTEIYVHSPVNSNLNESMTVTLPASTNRLPTGWYSARVGANAVYSDGVLVQAGPPKPAAPPSAATGTAVGTSTMLWTWPDMAGVDGYNIYQSSTGIFLGTTPALGSPFFYQSQLAANTTCSVLVAGYTITGDGPRQASSANYTLSTAPTSVTIASTTFDSLLLHWNVNGNAQGTVYEVSMSTDFPSPFSQSVSTPVPSVMGLTQSFVTIDQLQPGTTYSFRLRAFNGSGLPSTFSAHASTITHIQVSGVEGTALSPSVIRWAWRDSGSGVTYRIFNSSTGLLLGQTSSLNYDDIGLATNTARSVQVAALTSAGLGPLSIPTTVYTSAAAPLPGNPPITNLSTGGFTINWRADDGNPAGTRYRTNLATLVGSQVSLSSFMTTGFPLRLTLGGLSPSQLYGIVIYALNGDDLASAPLVIGSTYTLPRSPTNLQILARTPTTIDLAWDPNQNPTNVAYQVTYSNDGFLSVSTAIPFSANFTLSSTTITGLLTSTTYQIEILARNPFGQTSAPLRSDPVSTTNGGAAPGALAGILTALANAELVGTIAVGPPNPNGTRSIDLRSPAGAFSSDVNLTISSYDATVPLCPNGVNIALRLEASPLLQPSKPLYLRVSYDDTEILGLAPERLALMRYEPSGGTCVPLETTFDARNRLFISRLNHFSLYQVAQIPASSSAGSARIFPNPYHAATDGYVTVADVPPYARVRVTTLQGETLLDQKANAAGLLTWSATNGSGRALASGLYLVLVESPSSKKILKLAVIR